MTACSNCEKLEAEVAELRRERDKWRDAVPLVNEGTKKRAREALGEIRRVRDELPGGGYREGSYVHLETANDQVTYWLARTEAAESRCGDLEAALAKAHGHINSLGDPCNDLVPGEGITVSERDVREALRFQTKRIEVLEAVVANVPHLVVMKDGERPQAFHENPDGSVWRPEHIAKDCARFGGRCAALAGLPGGKP